MITEPCYLSRSCCFTLCGSAGCNFFMCPLSERPSPSSLYPSVLRNDVPDGRPYPFGLHPTRIYSARQCATPCATSNKQDFIAAVPAGEVHKSISCDFVSVHVRRDGTCRAHATWERHTSSHRGTICYDMQFRRAAGEQVVMC